MNDEILNQIAENLELLAAQSEWEEKIWQRCYDLVNANCDNELVGYVHDDLIHCTATSVRLFSFGRPPKHPMFEMYRQEFRDVAAALRSRMSLSEYKQKYE